MNTDYIKGVIVPIITVIDEDEKIDEAGMRRQVEFVIKGCSSYSSNTMELYLSSSIFLISSMTGLSPNSLLPALRFVVACRLWR